MRATKSAADRLEHEPEREAGGGKDHDPKADESLRQAIPSANRALEEVEGRLEPDQQGCDEERHCNRHDERPEDGKLGKGRTTCSARESRPAVSSASRGSPRDVRSKRSRPRPD